MYAACIKPRVQANDLAALVMLLESMATFAAGEPAQAHSLLGRRLSR